MAVWRRGKPDALMHHSDRGSQYASEQFQRLMAESGIVCSMSRSGNVSDNAAMASFFSSLKAERTERKTYHIRNEARADVFDYIERFYNAVRRAKLRRELSGYRRLFRSGFRRPRHFRNRCFLVYHNCPVPPTLQRQAN